MDVYKEIYLIIDKCLSDETIKRKLIKAFNYYKESEEAEMEDEFLFIISDKPSGKDVLKEVLREWKSDEEKLNVITEINNKLKGNDTCKWIIYWISETLEKEESKCVVIDNKLSIWPESLIDTLGVKKKNEYTVKLLGKNFIKFFLALPKDRQIQLFASLNKKDQSFKNAAADVLFRINMQDLINPKSNIQNFNIDKNISIGVELETIGKASDLLYNADYLVGYKRTILGNKWHISMDDSLGRDGIEIISPVMYNTEQYSKQLYAICEFLKLIGNTPNEKCGGHVHMGADYLKSKYSLANLYEIIGNCEEIYYLVACEEGKFVPSRIDSSIKPISEKLKLAIGNGEININSRGFVNSLEKVQGTFDNVTPDKKYGINILNYGRKKPLSQYGEYRHTGVNTIEFRAFANPDSYEGWIQNIHIAGKLMEISEKLGQIDSKKDKNEDEKKLVDLREMLKEDISSSEKIKYFLDLVFECDIDKEICRKRFWANYKIVQKEENEEVRKKLAFNKIEFGERIIDSKIKEVEETER